MSKEAQNISPVVCESVNLDLSKEEDSSKSPYSQRWHSDKAKMELAKLVLIGLFSIFIMIVIVNFFDKAEANALLEVYKTGFLPIITLILGYYFAKES